LVVSMSGSIASMSDLTVSMSGLIGLRASSLRYGSRSRV